MRNFRASSNIETCLALRQDLSSSLTFKIMDNYIQWNGSLKCAIFFFIYIIDKQRKNREIDIFGGSWKSIVEESQFRNQN